MKIGGTYTISAPRQSVWDGLIDPAILKAAIPGAERFEETSPGKFEVEIGVGIGIIRGRFHGTVELTDLNPPSSQRLVMNGEGTVGVSKAGDC